MRIGDWSSDVCSSDLVIHDVVFSPVLFMLFVLCLCFVLSRLKVETPPACQCARISQRGNGRILRPGSGQVADGDVVVAVASRLVPGNNLPQFRYLRSADRRVGKGCGSTC